MSLDIICGGVCGFVLLALAFYALLLIDREIHSEND